MMANPESGHIPYSQYGSNGSQYSTPYANVNPWNYQYGFPPGNPDSMPYQANVNQYSHSDYQPDTYSCNSFGDGKSQRGNLNCQNNSYGPPYNPVQSSNQSAPPPFNGESFYNQTLPQCGLNQPSYNQAPPLNYNQIPPPNHNQAPAPHYQPKPPYDYNHGLTPTYNQVPPPSDFTENAINYQNSNSQQGYECQEYGPNYTSFHNQNYLPDALVTYGPTAGPQKAPKRPRMPAKLQTSFKMAKKSSSLLHQPLTSLQPLQGGKSALCTVNNMARENGWTINWFDEAETGPPHAKVFSIKVTMGPYEVSGCGRSKKLAKQDASQLLAIQVAGYEVADIMGLPAGCSAGGSCQPIQSASTSEDYGPQLPPSEGKKTNPLVHSGGDNPISALDHIAKKHKFAEPNYVSVCENGPLALQRFEIKVTFDNMEASGLGRSKKVAKRNAAQAMLDQMARTRAGIKRPKQRIAFVKASSSEENGK